MPCIIINGRPMTLGEAKDILGEPREYLRRRSTLTLDARAREEDRCRKIEDAANAELVARADDPPMFMCGEAMSSDGLLCRCGHLADMLCDWPMGKGKTCDLSLCPDCARLKRSGARTLNPWPPKRSGDSR